jgi:hypothetical protein
MDEYSKQKLMNLLRVISLEELYYRAKRATNDEDRQIWRSLYILKKEQRAMRQ